MLLIKGCCVVQNANVIINCVNERCGGTPTTKPDERRKILIFVPLYIEAHGRKVILIRNKLRNVSEADVSSLSGKKSRSSKEGISNDFPIIYWLRDRLRSRLCDRWEKRIWINLKRAHKITKTTWHVARKAGTSIFLCRLIFMLRFPIFGSLMLWTAISSALCGMQLCCQLSFYFHRCQLRRRRNGFGDSDFLESRTSGHV